MEPITRPHRALSSPPIEGVARGVHFSLTPSVMGGSVGKFCTHGRVGRSSAASPRAGKSDLRRCCPEDQERLEPAALWRVRGRRRGRQRLVQCDQLVPPLYPCAIHRAAVLTVQQADPFHSLHTLRHPARCSRHPHLFEEPEASSRLVRSQLLEAVDASPSASDIVLSRGTTTLENPLIDTPPSGVPGSEPRSISPDILMPPCARRPRASADSSLGSGVCVRPPAIVEPRPLDELRSLRAEKTTASHARRPAVERRWPIRIVSTAISLRLSLWSLYAALPLP